MLKRILLSLLCFSGWKAASCASRRYYYVADPMTWTEAQNYCRQKHTDLASIRNSEDMSQLLFTLLSSTASAVWIGLYTSIDWKWSDGYKGTDYSRWTSAEPNFYGAGQFCAQIDSLGKWFDDECYLEFPFFCYQGNQQDPAFVFISQSMNWSNAQRYCRENYIDLATIRNDEESQRIVSLGNVERWAWFGLHRDPNIFWSDGSGATFTHWDSVFNPLGSNSVMCGVANLDTLGKWRLVPCEVKSPFVCYSQEMQQQVIKLRMKAEDSVDLNDPSVKADILKKLQDKLQKTGSGGLTLKWREQPDGKVFHKEEESPRMKMKEKNEF